MRLLIIFPIVFMLNMMTPSVSCSRKRSRTTTTTEASAPVNLEQTLAERESSLLDREENFRAREVVLREREEKLTLREGQFQEREDKLSQREKNIHLREQNTVRGSCSSPDGSSTQPPDYDAVRWDREFNKLQDIGEVGSCSENMRFFANPSNETEGKCDCDYHASCSRPLLYSDKYKQCFWAWSQGPCEQKEWYVFDENYMPICEPNPCPESIGVGTPSYYFMHYEDGKCYKAGSKGPCKKKGERLFTLPDDPIPKCRKSSLCPPQSIQQICLPGNRRYFDGHCSHAVADDDVSQAGEEN